MTKKQKKTIKEEIEEVVKKELPEIHGRRLPQKLAKKVEPLIRQTLQRFIEETNKEINPQIPDWLGGTDDEWRDGFFEAIKEIYQKQQQWLKKNL